MKRIIVYVIMLVFLVGGLGFGTYTLIKETSYKNNNVSFTLKNDDAFFVASGSYYKGYTKTITFEEPNLTYDAHYLEEEKYNGVPANISPWNIGHSEFIRDVKIPENNIDIFVIELSITNKNSDKNLLFEIKNIATEVNQYFTTTVEYKQNQNAFSTMYSNENKTNIIDPLVTSSQDNKKININAKSIAWDNTLTIRITYKLNTKTHNFTYVNNLAVELSTQAI